MFLLILVYIREIGLKGGIGRFVRAKVRGGWLDGCLGLMLDGEGKVLLVMGWVGSGIWWWWEGMRQLEARTWKSGNFILILRAFLLLLTTVVMYRDFQAVSLQPVDGRGTGTISEDQAISYPRSSTRP